MPNYCDNNLTISGKQEHILNFLNDFTIKDEFDEIIFSMNAIVPEPSEKENSWYDWRLENWGCKWDIDCNLSPSDIFDQIITITDKDTCNEVTIPYTTPWGPNLNFIEKVSEKYPDLKFNIQFYEPGCLLAGDFSYENGNEIEHFCNNDNTDLFNYYVWCVENSFEDSDYILNEMDLEEYDKDLYDKLYKYFNNNQLERDDESEEEEDILDLSNFLLGNNLPEPK